MDSLFIVPALVSPNVNPKLVPAIAKMVERSILLNNAVNFKRAALIRYKNINKMLNPDMLEKFGIRNESYLSGMDPNTRYRGGSKNSRNNKEDEEEDGKIKKFPKYNNSSRSGSKSSDEGMFTKVAKGVMDRYSPDAGAKRMKRAIDKLKFKDAKARGSQGALFDTDTEKSLRPITTGIEDVEIPRGFTFYKQISTEPTILEIPIQVKLDKTGENYATNIVKIGVKCIPYTISDVKSIKNVIKYQSNMKFMERQFFKFKSVLLRSPLWRDVKNGLDGFLHPEKREIFKGTIILPEKAKLMITYSPSQFYFSNPNFIAKRMSGQSAKNWTTMLILTTSDFKDSELHNLISNYKKLSKMTFGDIVLTNKTKESIYFCLSKMGHCNEIQMDYLKKVLDLNNVLEYSVITRHSSPWRLETKAQKTNIKTAVTNIGKSAAKLKENCPICEKNKTILEMKQMEKKRNDIRFVMDSYINLTKSMDE